MLWLIGLGIGAVILFAASGNKGQGRGETAGTGWSIALQGPAALPQTALPELAAALNINNYDRSRSFITSPQMGMNVLTIVSDDVMPDVGTNIVVQGVPLHVLAVQPAPI